MALLRSPVATQGERDEAARRLVARQSPQAREALLAALIDAGNRPAQLAAARAIALDRAPAAAFKVPLSALIGGDPRLTEAAILALANFRADADVRNQLTRLALDPARPQREPTPARLAAIRALGTMSDKQSAETLVGLAGNEAEPAPVRDEAAAALANMTAAGSGAPDPTTWQRWWQENQPKDDATFTRELLEAQAAQRARDKQRLNRLAQETEALLVEAYQAAPETRREGMLLRLLKAGEPENREVGAELVQADFKQTRPIPQSVREQLRTMIGDSSSTVRVRVANALFLLNDEQAIDALLAQLESEPDADVRRELAQALVPTRDARVVPPLLNLLNDPSLAVAEEAARGLGDTENLTPVILQDKALAGKVGDGLRDTLRKRTGGGAGGAAAGTTSFRAALVDAMGALKNPEFRQAFTELLGPNEPVAVRRAAIRALGDLGQPDAAQWLVDLLRDKDPAIRAEAVAALGKTADASHAEAIFDFMNRETVESIRAAEWRVLSNIFTAVARQPGQAPWLNRWADRFRNQPQRQLEVLEALAKRLEADNRAADLATVRLNIGGVMMKLSEEAEKAGDTAAAENRAAQAAAVFQLALDHFRIKDPRDQNMETGSVREGRIVALMRSRNYDEAASFAAQSIKTNPANQDQMGRKLKGEVDSLQTAGRLDDALKLIDAINGMNPALADQYLQPIQRFEEQIKERRRTPRSSVGVGGNGSGAVTQ